MSPLDRFWTGVLSLLAPFITPDWGALIKLIPLGLALIVIAYAMLMVRAWVREFRNSPTNRRRRRSMKPVVIAHFAVILAGVAFGALAFDVGSKDPSWNGAQSPFGLVVNLPLLFLGVFLAVASAGNGARLWERSGAEVPEDDAVDLALAALRAHPARTRRLAMFFGGALIAAVGLIIKPDADPVTGIQPVATLQILLPGLALAIAAVGSTIAAAWPADPDLDAPVTSGDHA